MPSPSVGVSSTLGSAGVPDPNPIDFDDSARRVDCDLLFDRQLITGTMGTGSVKRPMHAVLIVVASSAHVTQQLSTYQSAVLQYWLGEAPLRIYQLSMCKTLTNYNSLYKVGTLASSSMCISLAKKYSKETKDSYKLTRVGFEPTHLAILVCSRLGEGIILETSALDRSAILPWM